jgi:hypothetical protein
MNAGGTGKRQITSNGAANFAPFFHPDGGGSFASNARAQGPELLSTGPRGQDRPRARHLARRVRLFPMFSDGRSLVWASNRFNAKPGDTNLFVAGGSRASRPRKPDAPRSPDGA